MFLGFRVLVRVILCYIYLSLGEASGGGFVCVGGETFFYVGGGS